MVTRREFVAAPAILRAQSKSKPHLLLLMADQHRGDWLGCDGTRAVSTPNLDGLASQGVRFKHAYSATPSCTPARSALLTGMSPWKHGMLGYGQVAEKYSVEMPRLLRDAGYYTTGIGKMHWHPQRNLHGFHKTLLDESGRVEAPEFLSDYRAWFKSEAPNLDPDATGIGWNDCTAKPYVLPERLHPSAWTADCAVRFLESYQRPDPWFLKVSFARPHSPYDPPQRWWDKYKDADLPKAVVGDWAAKYATRSWERDDIWHGDIGEALTRRARVGYSGSVSFIDEQIGRVLAALDKRGWSDDTFIIYLSDHGDMTGDHHLWRKTYAYEASARIPMLIRGPGVKRGTVSSVPVEIRDVLPTLASAAGLPVPSGCDGQNILTAKREWIDLEHYTCYDKTNFWTGVTDGQWKYIRSQFDGSEQLFDLRRDRSETQPSNDQNALQLWRSRMDQHLAVRGPNWQKNLYSPNYPGTTSSASAAVK